MTTKLKKLVVIIFPLFFSSLALNAQIVRTIAGNGITGNSGDNGAATSASLNSPIGMVADLHGNLYVSDEENNMVKKISPSGVITAIAGTGMPGYSGARGRAVVSNLSFPMGMAIDASGNLYVADDGNSVVQKIDTAGNITTVAGTGFWGCSGNGGPATRAKLNGACAVAFDHIGNMYIADGNAMIRKVDTSGIITTVAGNGDWGYSGDGGLAVNASLSGPTGIAVDDTGNLYIADNLNNVIRKVNTAGYISTFAGLGEGGFRGDGGYAVYAKLNRPNNVCFDANGNLYISDVNNARIRKVDTAGIITTVAGNGTNGYSGDGGAPLAASFSYPSNIAFSASGTMFIADLGNHVVREVMNNNTIGMTVSPGTAICANTPVTFTGYGIPPDAFGLIYQWSLNNVPIASDTITSFVSDSLNNGDKITFSIIDPSGNFNIFVDSATMTVNAVLIPSVTISNNKNSRICLGTSVTFSATEVNGGSAPVYEWLVNGADSGSGATFTYTPNDSDVVQCSLTSSYGCAIPAMVSSNINLMNVGSIQHTSVTISSTATTVCENQNVTLTANPVNGGTTPLIYWQKFGVIVDSGTSYSYTPATGDIITSSMVSSAACPFPAVSESNELTMLVNPIVTPAGIINAFPSDSVSHFGEEVTLYSEVSYGGTAPTYQWYMNNTPIPGATSNTISHIMYENDTFYCVNTSNAPCATQTTDTSNMMVIYADYLAVPEVHNNAAFNLQIAPNPNNGSFVLNGTIGRSVNNDLNIEVVDLVGQVVYAEKVSNNNGKISERINLNNNIAPGVYVMHITSGSEDQKITFVIQK